MFEILGRRLGPGVLGVILLDYAFAITILALSEFACRSLIDYRMMGLA